MKFTATKRKFIGIELKGTRKEIRDFIEKHKKKGYVEFALYKGKLCHASFKIKSNRWYTTFLKRIRLPAILEIGEWYEITVNPTNFQLIFMKEAEGFMIIKNGKKTLVKNI